MNNLIAVLAILFFITLPITGCEKKTNPVINEHVDPHSIEDLQIINTSFFGHTGTAEKIFIVSGDGKIIARDNHQHRWQSVLPPAIVGKFSGIASDKTGAKLLAYGEAGLVVYSGDAGKTWQQRNPGISKTFTNALFDEENQRWLVIGQDGTALSSNADATAWTTLPLQLMQTLVKILQREQHTLIIGEKGLIAFSKDSNNDWQIIDTGLDEALTDITAIDAQQFVASSSLGKLVLINLEQMKTEIIDSGYSSYISKTLYDQANKTMVAITANSEILLSDDGGRLWAPVVVGKAYLNSVIQSADTQFLWAAGDRANILRSQNGGRTWDTLNLPENANIEGLINPSGSQLIAYGENGALFQSPDHGNTWETINRPINEFTHQIIQANSGAWYGAGIKGQLITAPRDGKRWQLLDAPTQENEYFLSIVEDKQSGNVIAAGPPGSILVKKKDSDRWDVKLALNDSSLGYFHRVITDNHGKLITVAGPGSIFYSHDAGDNWQKANDHNTGPQLFTGIYDENRKKFFAAGQSGVIKFSSTGEHWESATTSSSHTVQALYANKDFMLAAGDKGSLLRSEDGASWEPLSTPVQVTLIALFESKQHTLLATGNQGVILRSEDQGKSWTQINSPTPFGLRTPVQDKKSGIIYIANRNGEIIYSRNDGLTWEKFSVIANGSIKSLVIDYENNMLIGAGDKLIRIPLL